MVATPNLGSPLTDKVILVIGGSGSWGQEFARIALKHNPKVIRVFYRGMLRQVEMERSGVECALMIGQIGLGESGVICPPKNRAKLKTFTPK